MLYVLFAIVNYLIGSIPWALIIGEKFFNTDVRKYGSGNLGATNAGRVLGKNAAFTVGALDMLKGFASFLIESLISYPAALATTLFTAIGHCFPVFAQFKGGKAVAVSAGIILGVSITSFRMMLLCVILPLGIWILISKFTSLVSLASLYALLVCAAMSTFASDNIYVTLIFTLLFVIVAIRHKDNIVRLIQGTESKKDY